MPKNIRVILIIRVQKSRVQAPRERPAANNVRAIRARIKYRARSACKKLFVSFGLLPPFGLWAFGESRVQKYSVQAPVSAKPRTRVRSVCV